MFYKNFLIKKKTKDDCLVMPKRDGKEVDHYFIVKVPNETAQPYGNDFFWTIEEAKEEIDTEKLWKEKVRKEIENEEQRF